MTIEKPRRRFLQGLLNTSFVATAVAIIYPIWRFVMPPETAESAQISATITGASTMPPNSGRIFQFGQEPGLLIRTPEGDWRAFSAVCTHLNCTVAYDDQSQLIVCACHNGTFDLSGKNVGGPPPRPLEAYSVNVRGDDLVVSKV